MDKNDVALLVFALIFALGSMLETTIVEIAIYEHILTWTKLMLDALSYICS